MTTMTIKQIDDAFTAMACYYINRKGLMISPFTQGGSYSDEHGHIDLIDPNDCSYIIRIWLMQGRYSIDNKSYWHGFDTIKMMVKKYTDPDTKNIDIARSKTLWPNKGESLYEKEYYAIGKMTNGKSYVYTDDVNTAINSLNLAMQRIENRPYGVKCYNTNVELNRLTPKFVDSIMKRINSIKGFKRAHADCITSVKLSNVYCYQSDSNRLQAQVKYSFNGKDGIITLK